MDYYLVFLLILPFVWASIRVRNFKLASQTLPPGPKPFPIIGNILQLSNLPHQALAKLSKTYGPLMTLKLGSITTIVISSPNLAKEALQRHDQAFSSRSIPDMAHVFDHHNSSMGWLPTNSKWKNLRKACATQIFATQRLDATQALRQTKVQELLDHVNKSCKSGAPIDIGRLVFTTVLNSISNTFFSMDLAQYDSKLSQEFRDLVCGVADEAGRPNIADYFPALRMIDPQGVRKRTSIYFTKLFGIFDVIFNQRLQLRASSDGSKASNDVLDSLLNLSEEDNSEISLIDIKHLLLDLFLADKKSVSLSLSPKIRVLTQKQFSILFFCSLSLSQGVERNLVGLFDCEKIR
nr:ferruginol synthase [Quercus suber]